MRILFALIVLILGATATAADGPLTLPITVPVGSKAHDLDLQGDFLYVATEAGLTIVDVSSPDAPVVRGSVAAPRTMGIKVRGQYAYLASPLGAFRVVDVSHPDAPVVVASRTVAWAYDVALKDDVAFIAGFAGEMYVLDISDPLNPGIIKTLGLPAWKSPAGDTTGLARLNAYAALGNAKASGVVIRGNALLTTDWGYGRIYYYDVSTPASPVFRGTHYAPYVFRVDVDLDRDVVFMLSAYGVASGIYTVPLSSLRPDISTAHATCAACGYLASTVPTVGLDQGGMALGAGGGYLVYGGGRNNGEFHVVDVRNPLAMTYAATVPIGPHQAGLAYVMGARISGDRAYFAAGALGVQVYRFPGLSEAVGAPPPDAPPTVATFAINGGASSTTNRVVTLNNGVSGVAVEYRVAESSDPSGAAWLPYGAAPSFSLTGANGTRQVSFQVRDAAARESAIVTDTIVLSEPVPAVTGFTINAGAGTTTSRTVTLNATVSNSPTEYRASESSAFTGAAWQPYTNAPSFELTVRNTTKRVYFQARNAAGTSAVYSDTIVLSEPTPLISRFAINNGVSSTASRSVTLDNTASGAPIEYRASQSSTFVGAVWLPYAPAPVFQLSAGIATKRVYFQLRNAAGAVSPVVSDTIVLSQ